MDEVDNAQIIVIADDVCRNAGIATTWINSNRFGIHAYKHVDKDSQDTKSQFAPCDAKVHFLRPEIILFSPILRKLVNESNGIFLSVQKLKSSSGDIRPELLKHSKQYRSILRACVENLQEILPKEPLSEEKTMLKHFLTIFYHVECAWHLTEILYVDTVPGDVVLPQLLEWISFHFPSRELAASKILSQKRIGADLENENYWDAVMGCAFHGELNLVCRLLALHSKADDSAFITADNIIRTMPVYNVYGGYSVNEFITRWKHWQMDLCSNLESNCFSFIDDNKEKDSNKTINNKKIIDRNLETLMKVR
ncbi:hypothetical protein PUN28_000695 [Cardiocondyla obscurior]|uniref:Nuclear pore complex protein Nup85 n=1 Tax=Cardiocondyla obscurior TaxID=286306 RepID=A0AAW2H0Z4_9HYME